MAKKGPLERVIVAKVMAAAKALGYWSMKNHGSAFSLAGVPDVLVIKDGKACWMEVKRPGEKPTPIQVARMRELASVGCPVAVVTSGDEAKKFLERL